MKRSYFFFYGFAVAYCINMLFAWQIENSSNIHSTVQKSTVSSLRFNSSGFNYKAYHSVKYSEKDKAPVFSKTIAKISRLHAGARWQKLLCDITKTTQPDTSGIHYSKDSKHVEGFTNITEFPDKLS
ncbi:hypothetical protein N0B40_18690 [Chryseobacterium oranimense]|uniref:hypothetical protein n=1 Tax=Chryseobacterium oranimense TaxID=421058 RepID=UPI0021AEEE04|nr:hypothetical protein [Chryseobacterium oranimense]UWX60406.1 hypothetical protein N0B40_18690 [Chryseobacterium oranimense]